ncbi:MAG TPA: hypothetical protein VJZ78_07320 [Anaerolineales bacterium]|nr:hypothetical protein [Anaerolineales bacterium]
MLHLLQLDDLPGPLSTGLCVFVRCDHNGGVGDGRTWQWFNGTDGTILGAQIGKFAEVEGAHGALVHAGGVDAFSEVIFAEGALGHNAFRFVELGSSVRAGPFAVAAADAFVSVDQHNAVITLGDGSRRADVGTQGILAVHACG